MILARPLWAHEDVSDPASPSLEDSRLELWVERLDDRLDLQSLPYTVHLPFVMRLYCCDRGKVRFPDPQFILLLTMDVSGDNLEPNLRSWSPTLGLGHDGSTTAYGVIHTIKKLPLTQGQGRDRISFQVGLHLE